jgi:hypothetical protein
MREHAARGGRFTSIFRRGGNVMLDRSETLGLFATIVFMSLFTAGIAYEGVLLKEPQRTAQLVVPDLNP